MSRHQLEESEDNVHIQKKGGTAPSVLRLTQGGRASGDSRRVTLAAAYTLRLVWSCAICDVLSRSMMAYPHGISLWFSMPWQKISEKSKQ